MPNLILELQVDRVDLVDEGANSAAFIKMYKRKEPKHVMGIEEIIAKMKPEHAEVINDAIAKAKDEVPEKTQAELDAAKKEKEAAEEEVKKFKKELEDVEIAKSKSAEPDFEEVMKSLDPSVQEVFKSMKIQKEAAEEVARQAADKSLVDEAVAKAKALKSLPVEEATLVDVLKGISPEVHEVLKAANKAIEDGGLFEEVGKAKGSNLGNANEAWDKIEKSAKALQESEKISYEAAITKSIKENPDLYREYLKGGN